MQEISKARVVITGASSGIGAAIAEQLLAAEAEVIALCRTAPPLAGITHLPTDLRDTDSIRTAMEQVGEITALINNAGMAYSSRITEGNLEEWDEMWQVNVRALAYCSALALAHFPSTGGQIINLSSMSGHRVPPSGGFYSPTKFAVRAITESLRLELRGAGNTTRVSSVSPGFVDTPLLETYFRGKEEQLTATRAAVDFLTPQDVAAQVIHILRTPLHVEIGDIAMRSSSQSV